MSKRALAMLSLMVPLAAGCATFGGGEPAAEAADVTELQRRVLDLQRRAAMADVEIDRLRRQVAELEARLGSGAGEAPGERAAAAAPPPSAPSPVVDSAPTAVEESRFEESELETPAVAVAPPPAVEEPIGGSVDDAPPPAAAEPAAAASASVAALDSEPITAEAQAIYDRGYTLYHQGRYLDAESSFQRFLQGFPATELTDNAQYWVGECRFARGDVEGALAAFQETVERYPDGNKVADALLKMGDCERALGREDRARERFEEVVRRFPGSAASTMAEERLAGG